MTKGELNLLYAEVDKLLNDICNFLNEEADGGYLSEKGKRLASVLIERSKKQLQTIAMTVESDTSDSILESYVDMQAYKVNPNEPYPDPQEVYSDVSLTYEPSLRLAGTDDQCICPFTNMPAYEIKNGKSGFLFRKEKILFFEQQRKVYAAIQQTWLLIYLNENAPKPCQTFDLSRYDVRASQKDIKKRDESFELVSFADSKMFQFTAHTSKDMYQWVSAIKRQMESIVTTRHSISVPSNNVTDFSRLSTDSNNDYEPLKNYIIKESETSNIRKEKMPDPPVPLPPRNATIRKKSPVQTRMPSTPSTESLSSNYDSVGCPLLPPSRETSYSFSEEDSDMHYDDPSELRQQVPFVKQYEETKDDDDDNDIYDYLEKPSFPPNTNFQSQGSTLHQTTHNNKPKIELKPKPVLKPKLLSLRNRKKSGA